MDGCGCVGGLGLWIGVVVWVSVILMVDVVVWVGVVVCMCSCAMPRFFDSGRFSRGISLMCSVPWLRYLFESDKKN